MPSCASANNTPPPPVVCGESDDEKALEELAIRTEVAIKTAVGSAGGRKALLIRAIEEGNTSDVITILEEEGSLASCSDDKGCTLLHVACIYDRFSIIRHLRGFEVDMNAADNWGGTPLHAACRNSKNPDLLDYLVRQGASVDAVFSWGTTILHLAAVTGNVTGIEFALARGVHVDARDNCGWTALSQLLLSYNRSLCKDDDFEKVTAFVSGYPRSTLAIM